jgi:hypothetical protein
LSLFLAALLLVAGFVGGSLMEPAPVQANMADRHPHIRAAIRELRDARKEIDEGAKIFGGHRVKALKAVDDAIEQLQKAVDYADK